MKALTAEQAQSRKDKAVRFVRDVLRDDDRADEIERESLDDYADRRKFQIVNPNRRKGTPMAGKTTTTKAELEQRVSELEDALNSIKEKADEALDPESTRQEMVVALKEIFNLAEGDEDEDEDGDEADEEEEEDEEEDEEE